MSPAAPLASSNNLSPPLSFFLSSLLSFFFLASSNITNIFYLALPPGLTTFSRPALDWAWDPYSFYDMYEDDWHGVRFVNGKWRMLDEQGEFMFKDSGSDESE